MNGTDFLIQHQGSDGLWRDFFTLAGESTDWATAYIAVHLAAAGAPAPKLEHAARALVERQRPDGGWAYNERAPTDVDSTAWVLLFLAPRADTPVEVVERAAAHLVAHQRGESGGLPTYPDPQRLREFIGLRRPFSEGGWCRSHVEVTAVAGRALAVAGARWRAAALAAWRFVAAHQRSDGAWPSYWWASPSFATLHAIELARALGGQVDTRRAIERAARSLAWGDGGAPSVERQQVDVARGFDAALELVARARVGLDVDFGQEAALLRALRCEDGGWLSRPILRLPHPWQIDPDESPHWRMNTLGTGVIISDQHRLITTATCVGALAVAGGEA